MEFEHYNKNMDTLAYWVFLHHDNINVDVQTCPKVGYLGYANGMTQAEWTIVDIAKSIITSNGGDWREFFDYDVDSSD